MPGEALKGVVLSFFQGLTSSSLLMSSLQILVLNSLRHAYPVLVGEAKSEVEEV